MRPGIAGFVADLMFQTRIESVAENLNMRVYWFENIEQVTKTNFQGLATLGPDRIMIDHITRIGARLIIFDLANSTIPWETMIPYLKKIPATRRIPLVSYGSHVDADTLKRARRAGSDDVMARSRFVTSLPEILIKYVGPVDKLSWDKSCSQSLHPDAVKGLKLFNQGNYFDAHEYLEEAWMEDLSKGRDLYRGVLQIAVAYFHIRQGNFRGAVKMFQRARYWLNPLPGHCRGVDVAQLRVDSYAIYDRVIGYEPDSFNEFPIEELKPVVWQLN